MPLVPSPYQLRIRAIVGDVVDARHVEAYMRAEHGTLDNLSPEDFEEEAKFCVTCALMAGTETAERLARSYGL